MTTWGCRVAIALLIAGCGGGGGLPDPEIKYGRNSQFGHPWARVFRTLDDGTPLSVNTADDAIATGPGHTIIPGHRARGWTFLKEEAAGTSVVHAVFNWNGDDPADYLMLGSWAWFPGQQQADLSFEGPMKLALILDGPELDIRSPPDMPLSGTATYSGRASGLYGYFQGEDRRVRDAYEGTVTLTADFGAGTVAGCIGCVGDIVTRVSGLDVLRGRASSDQPADLTDYEVHLSAAPYNPDSTFEHTDVTVTHPTRAITTTRGHWGGSFSNVPDDEGSPRLIGGFNSAGFEDEHGQVSSFLGSFVGVSETYRDATE